MNIHNVLAKIKVWPALIFGMLLEGHITWSNAHTILYGECPRLDVHANKIFQNVNRNPLIP